MTIKQFMQVAAGALISLVIYSSNLAPYVKWPIIIISFLTGVALAFFPIEDRPLSKWIVLFVKAIYSPTVYIWNKNARKYEFFQPENAEFQIPVSGSAPINIPGTPTLAETQLQNPAVPAEDIKLDKQEEELLTKVDQQFATTPSATTQTVATPLQNIPPVGIPTTNATPIPQRQEVKLEVPESKNIAIEPQEKPPVVVKPPEFTADQTTTGQQVTPIPTQDMSQAKSATFSEDAAPPSPPTRPNVIVGQILGPNGKIVDGAILEIKDAEGRSVRALRSNRLGHFMIVTPLANGKFTISTEKDGYQFEPVSFEAKDQIIPPIAIWAKS